MFQDFDEDYTVPSQPGLSSDFIFLLEEPQRIVLILITPTLAELIPHSPLGGLS